MQRWARAALVGVGVTVVTVALHLVVLQWWAGPYPISSRWWADGFVLTAVLMAAVVTVAAAGMGDGHAGVWLRNREVADTPSARRYARSWVSLTRASRAIGFFGVVLLGAVAGWSVNTSGLPPGSPVRERLIDVGGGWFTAVVGYAVGALVAELLRRPPARDGGRRADLRPRVPAAYMQPMARWGPRVLGLAALGLAGLTAALGYEVAITSSAELATTAAGTVGATEAIRWATVRHRQRMADPEHVALDDAARATTIHAVSGSAIAIIGSALGNHLWGLSLDLSGPLRWASMAGSSVGLLSFGVWLGYGVGLIWVVRRGPSASAGPTGSAA